MFSGEERVTISTDLSEEEFDEKLQETLDSLGRVEVGKNGEITISPKTSMVSFLSTVTITGEIKGTDDGYKVNIQYSVSPSPICWIGAILLFCLVFIIGGIVIFAPLVLDKPNIARSVENALRDLKDSVGVKKRRELR